ncbi:MAG: VWA domain-containing protein [Clostridia bacterium]|nr:VWA domain-containing protein [Clostridia bacterium]
MKLLKRITAAVAILAMVLLAVRPSVIDAPSAVVRPTAATPSTNTETETTRPTAMSLLMNEAGETAEPMMPQEVPIVHEAETETVTVTAESKAETELCVTPSAVGSLFPDTMAGCLSQAYDVEAIGEFEAATLSFPLPLNTGYTEPTVYYFSEREQTLTPLETAVVGQTATATVTEEATYILLDRVVYEGSWMWEEEWGLSDVYDTAEVVFVTDDSGSMRKTDPANRRLAFAADCIERLPQNSRVGVVRFASRAQILTPALTEPAEAATYFCDTYFRSDGGTSMFTAIRSGLSLYTDSPHTQKVMIVLTDGLSVDTFDYDAIVRTIAERGVRVFMIGYDEIPHYTSKTPEAFTADVGGTYYSAADPSAMEASYVDVSRRIDLSLDTDGDTIPDYYEDHNVAFNGLHVPLDKTKTDTDEDGIPDNQEVSVTLVYNEDGSKAYVKGVLLSDPTAVDGDGDGTPDAEDSAPFDNAFSGTLTSKYSTGNVAFRVDFSRFLGDNTVYDPMIGKLSSVLSAVAYEDGGLSVSDTDGTRKLTTYSVADVMSYFGMANAENTHLNELYDDNHISEVTISHRNLVADGEVKTLLAVVVRGTNGTIEEWSSNFDIGDLSKDTSDDDWVNVNRHKGFDVTATRIRRVLSAYIEAHRLHPASITYWVTGHSRGAAVANILGADLEREGKRTFVYTFAAPATTLDADTASYRTIFNIINEDDFVPCLPIESWGYHRYGRSTQNVSVDASYEKAWEKFTGISSYKTGANNMDARVQTIGKILAEGSDPRVDCYRYTCSCHGDGTNDTITITNNGMSEESREKAIAKIPQNALSVCTITRYEGGLISGWDFDVCQTPAYFMQLMAAFMAKEIDAYRFAVELNIADRYENAKSAIVGVGLQGAEHPHYAETYYFLTDYVTAEQFE